MKKLPYSFYYQEDIPQEIIDSCRTFCTG